MRNDFILVPACLLVIAVLPLPYGYYTLVRLVVPCFAAFLAWTEYQKGQAMNGWTLGFAMIALLFNPLVPIHLSKGSWFFIDLAAAATFALKWHFTRVKAKS